MSLHDGWCQHGVCASRLMNMAVFSRDKRGSLVQRAEDIKSILTASKIQVAQNTNLANSSNKHYTCLVGMVASELNACPEWYCASRPLPNTSIPWIIYINQSLLRSGHIGASNLHVKQCARRSGRLEDGPLDLCKCTGTDSRSQCLFLSKVFPEEKTSAQIMCNLTGCSTIARSSLRHREHGHNNKASQAFIVTESVVFCLLLLRPLLGSVLLPQDEPQAAIPTDCTI